MDTLTYADPIFGSGEAMVVALGDYVVDDAGLVVLGDDLVAAGSGNHRGYCAIKHPNGDSTFTSYEGVTKTTPKPGGPPDVSIEGKWQYTGGTGKFEGITGGGTYKGGMTPTGPAWELEGQYTLKR